MASHDELPFESDPKLAQLLREGAQRDALPSASSDLRNTIMGKLQGNNVEKTDETRSSELSASRKRGSSAGSWLASILTIAGCGVVAVVVGQYTSQKKPPAVAQYFSHPDPFDQGPDPDGAGNESARRPVRVPLPVNGSDDSASEKAPVIDAFVVPAPVAPLGEVTAARSKPRGETEERPALASNYGRRQVILADGLPGRSPRGGSEEGKPVVVASAMPASREPLSQVDDQRYLSPKAANGKQGGEQGGSEGKQGGHEGAKKSGDNGPQNGSNSNGAQPGDDALALAVTDGAKGAFDKESRTADSYGLGYESEGISEGEAKQHWYFEQQVQREQYAKLVENAPQSPFAAPLSTFGVDVDTASYANVRRFLTAGSLPPVDAVRVEELINYFNYSYPQPEGDDPFRVDMELADCPWRKGHWLLRVGLKGREIEVAKRPASNLVFLVDVSGSMADENKLPLLKQALTLLVSQLTENDRVSIVTYAGDTSLRLPATSGDQKEKIQGVINALASGGSTNGSAGIVLAYEQAAQGFLKEGTNRVILATDGDLNVGITSNEALVKLIEEKRQGGTFLTVLGFGEGNLQDAKMEGLADHGNGVYAYIDGLREARKVLVEQLSGTLTTIAKDVKIQIEFNPQEIAGYRLIGYENRALAAQDFANDKKDAGDIGAGHTVTALYELVPVGADLGSDEPKKPMEEPLKYQKTVAGAAESAAPAKGPEETSKPRELSEAAKNGELFTVKLRFKKPTADVSELREYVMKDKAKKFGQASSDFQFAASVAGYGMLLRSSPYRGDLTPGFVAEVAAANQGSDQGGYRAEFVDLVRKSAALLQHRQPEGSRW